MIHGYVYHADLYCGECIGKLLGDSSGSEAEAFLDRIAAERGIDRDDEQSFDSDDFPKVVFAGQIDDEICGCCGDRL